MHFSNTTEDGSSDSGPKSAVAFILKPIQYLRTNLKYDGFSPPQSQPNKAHGAGKRRRYTFREKANVVEKLGSLEARKEDIYRTELLSPPQYLVHENKIDASLISKWASNEAEIVKEASSEVTKELFAKQSPRRWFPEAEQQLYDLFMARRKRKLNVSTLWVTVTYRKLLRDIYPDNPKAVAFHPPTDGCSRGPTATTCRSDAGATSRTNLSRSVCRRSGDSSKGFTSSCRSQRVARGTWFQTRKLGCGQSSHEIRSMGGFS